MDLKAAHARAHADLEAAEEVLAAARRQVDEIRRMVSALERAIDLYERPVLVVEGQTDTEVLSGVNENDTVIFGEQNQFKEGQQVLPQLVTAPGME